MKTEAAHVPRVLPIDLGSRRPIRYAVVGASAKALAPVLGAFQGERHNFELAALVSDDARNGAPRAIGHAGHRTLPLAEFEACLAGDPRLGVGELDAVYLALPNDLRRDYAVRAANAGVHVLCERPLAPSAKDCIAMIAAADAGNVRLMTGYPLRFLGAHREVLEIVRSGRIGAPRLFESMCTIQVPMDDDLRLSVDHVGGPLHDLGIDMVHVARHVLAANPTEVVALKASNDDSRFLEVDEMAAWILRFPEERLAVFTCSYGAADVCSYRIVGTRGDLRVEAAHGAEEIRFTLTTEGRTTYRTDSTCGAIAAELAHFSQCIESGRDAETSGVDGLTDVRVIEAVLHSAALGGQPITLPPLERGARPAQRLVARESLAHPRVRREPVFAMEAAAGDGVAARAPRTVASVERPSIGPRPDPASEPKKPEAPTRPLEKPPERHIETPPTHPTPNMPGVPGTPPQPGTPTGPVAVGRAAGVTSIF